MKAKSNVEINAEFYIKKLTDLQYSFDFEDGHKDADRILVIILNKLGFKKLTKEYDKIEKWYG